MSNDNTIGQDVKTEATNDEGVNNPSVESDNIKTENNIPYARFKEQNDKLKSAQTELDSIKAGQEKARAKKMEEDGQLKELLAEKDNQLKSLQSKADKLDKIEADRRESLISKLPDDLKEDEDILAMSNNQLGKMMDKLTSHKPASVDTTSATRGLSNAKTSVKDMTTDEMRENWQEVLNSYK